MRRSSATSRQDRMGKAHRRQKSSGSTGYQFGYRLALQKSSCSCRQEKQLPNSSRPLIPAQCPILCRTGGEGGTQAVLHGTRAVRLSSAHKPTLTIPNRSKGVNRLLLACPCVTAQRIALCVFAPRSNFNALCFAKLF